MWKKIAMTAARVCEELNNLSFNFNKQLKVTKRKRTLTEKPYTEGILLSGNPATKERTWTIKADDLLKTAITIVTTIRFVSLPLLVLGPSSTGTAA
jgi:hypothetical protein